MLTTPVVTALGKAGRGRISVELDGRPWRVLPIEPVLAAGLSTGVPLDRERARRLRAELRRVEARSLALSALTRTDHTTATLRDRLAAGGVAPNDRERALETVRRAGLIDDARFAHGRASMLAVRGAGNALIRDDLERRGVADELVAAAIAALEPELERARRVVVAHGSVPRTLRRLAAKGFGEDVLDSLVADRPETELG